MAKEIGMKIKSVGVFVLVFCIGVLSGRSHAKDRLVIGYTAITGIKAGLWVAEDAGIFDKHNIQAELLLITSASKMVQAMLGGDVPFAAAGGNAAVDANLSGADMVMLGVLAKVPAFYIMAMPEIKTIEDLRGKAVGVTRFGSSTDFTMRYLLRKHGLNPDRDVTMIQAGDLNAAAAMLSRTTRRNEMLLETGIVPSLTMNAHDGAELVRLWALSRRIAIRCPTCPTICQISTVILPHARWRLITRHSQGVLAFSRKTDPVRLLAHPPGAVTGTARTALLRFRSAIA
jgi:hypothetical protein